MHYMLSHYKMKKLAQKVAVNGFKCKISHSINVSKTARGKASVHSLKWTKGAFLKRNKMLQSKQNLGEPMRQFRALLYSPHSSARLCPTCTSRTCEPRALWGLNAETSFIPRNVIKETFFLCFCTVFHTKLCKVVAFEWTIIIIWRIILNILGQKTSSS